MKLTIFILLFLVLCLTEKGYSQKAEEDTRANYADSLKNAKTGKSYFAQSYDTLHNNPASPTTLKQSTKAPSAVLLKTTVPTEKNQDGRSSQNVFATDSVLNRNFKKEN